MTSLLTVTVRHDEDNTQHGWGHTLGQLIDTYSDPETIMMTGLKLESHVKDITCLGKEYVSIIALFLSFYSCL
jgi:serine protease inhibitor ecotin